MAAVATEPGAAAIRSTAPATSDDGSPEPGSGPIPKETPEPEPAAELCGLAAEDGEYADGDGEERRHVGPGPGPGPKPQPGKVQDGAPGDQVTPNRSCPERLSPGEGGSAQTAQRSTTTTITSSSNNNSSSSSSIVVVVAAAAAAAAAAQPKPSSSAVFLHSFPAPPPPAGAEADLSAAEAAEPSTDGAGRGRAYAAVGQDALSDVPEDGGGLRRGCPEPDIKPAQALASASPSADTSCLPLLGGGGAQVQAQDLNLSLGSEVRVSLDHVIDDALVVSFRLGEKLFSGVLMDVSKRFGPYGIPVTPFPPRRDGARRAASPEPEAAGQEDAPPRPPKEPPLFQEGAPYPPPLFIRDTYNQALPQPPPRKIKRPKRRYRCEEPTSIMNAIKLRPRQVLCDKCKGATGGRRVGPPDPRAEEASRRRKAAQGPVSAEVKRLRSDRGAKLNSKKTPAAKGNDGGKKPARNAQAARNSEPPTGNSEPPTAPPLGENGHGEGKALTRAAALQKRKVHFTRRLQQLSAALNGPALPPRMRLKPQRYRTDESQAPPSSPSPSARPPSSSADLDDARAGPRPPASRSVAPPSPFRGAPEEREGAAERADLSEGLSRPPPPSAGHGEGERPKRRRKSSTSSSSSSSSTSSSSAFSKSVSRCQLPDGRAVCVGDIVWAKIYGFPWWPARVLAMTVARRADGDGDGHAQGDGAGRREARVSWFGSPTTSFLPLAQLSPFLESFQSRFDRKRKGPYRRAISEAASAAKQLTPEVRALLTQFET
ncbi:PWWP domain-containing protein 2A [Stigmatopora argus]